MTKTALIASDFLLVPARPDHLSTLGIDYLIRSVNQLIRDYNEYASVQDGDYFDQIAPRILGVVFTMIQEYGGKPIAAQGQFMSMKELKRANVFRSYIKRNDTLFASASQYGVPVVLQNYHSGSHLSVVEGLEEVSDEFAIAAGVQGELKLWLTDKSCCTCSEC